jgi:hypothetical protein
MTTAGASRSESCLSVKLSPEPSSSEGGMPPRAVLPMLGRAVGDGDGTAATFSIAALGAGAA